MYTTLQIAGYILTGAWTLASIYAAYIAFRRSGFAIKQNRRLPATVNAILALTCCAVTAANILIICHLPSYDADAPATFRALFRWSVFLIIWCVYAYAWTRLYRENFTNGTSMPQAKRRLVLAAFLFFAACSGIITGLITLYYNHMLPEFF